jgi:hypothetical protein
MHRISIVAATAVAVAALAATSPAQADYALIRWQGTGFCQIWDLNIPTRPFPSNYQTVATFIPTFTEALEVKNMLMREGTCSF